MNALPAPEELGSLFCTLQVEFLGRDILAMSLFNVVDDARGTNEALATAITRNLLVQSMILGGISKRCAF